MSLLAEYNSLGHLAGFQLGFYKFFQAFKLDLSVVNTYSYKWNDVILSNGSVFEPQAMYIRPPCGCIKLPSPLGGYTTDTAKCSFCGHEPVIAAQKKVYSSQLGSYRAPLDELDEFAKEQLRWIQTQKKTRAVKEECQRRINFFVQALHTHLAGKHNYHTGRGTCDPFLRDIRNLAHLCLKE